MPSSRADGSLGRAHRNTMLAAVAAYVYENITSARTPEVAAVFGVPPTGDLAVHIFKSNAVRFAYLILHIFRSNAVIL